MCSGGVCFGGQSQCARIRTDGSNSHGRPKRILRCDFNSDSNSDSNYNSDIFHLKMVKRGTKTAFTTPENRVGPPEDLARKPGASRAKGAERVERGDGGDGGDGSPARAGTDSVTDELSKGRSAAFGNRVEVYGVVKALVEYASSKFAAAKWPPSSRLRETYRTLTDEELELARAAEALFVDIAAGGSAFAASELVNAGASEFLARRLRSLLSPEGDLLGVEAGSEDASEVAAEARTLAQALARVLMRNGAACLAEAARRDGAVDAVVRAFSASWRGVLGTPASVPEIEACVETLADVESRFLGATLPLQ